MTTPQKISHILEVNSAEEALALLRQLVADEPQNEPAWTALGRTAWKLGFRGEAITAYNNAVALNPDSPSRVLREQAQDILDFFCTDFYNP